MLCHQNAGNKERQSLKAIQLGCVRPCLPPLKTGQPPARIVVVEAAFPTRFSKAA